MKTQNTKLEFNTKSIIELQKDQELNIMGGTFSSSSGPLEDWIIKIKDFFD